MNERIKELAEQAGYKHPDAVGLCEDYAYFSHEKFAELIVREQLGIWELMDNGNKVEGYIEMEDYPKAVIKHFGVSND